MVVLTVGHGTLTADAFVGLLQGAGVRRVVDVRSFPGSRRNPQHGQAELERTLGDAGIGYTWLHRLGGRRRPSEGSRHVALRHEAFRAYADHMETDEFHGGVDELLALAAAEQVVVLCSESVWWRCHRRLLSDHLVLVRGIDVVHLMHDGRHTPHVPTAGVRVEGRRLVYDGGAPPTLFS